MPAFEKASTESLDKNSSYRESARPEDSQSKGGPIHDESRSQSQTRHKEPQVQLAPYPRPIEERILDLEKRIRELEEIGAKDSKKALSNDVLSEQSEEADIEKHSDARPEESTEKMKPDDLGDSANTSEEKKKIPQWILEVHRTSFHEFKPTLAEINANSSHGPANRISKYLIDVVVGSADTMSYASKQNGPLSSAAITVSDPSKVTVVNEAQQATPQRIRINSPLLLKVLTKITKHEFNSATTETQTILRPFKLFTIYEQEIRDYTQRLAEKHHHLIGADGDLKEPAEEAVRKNDASPSENSEQASLESKTCLEQLQVLVELLDIDLKPTLNLIQHIREGSLRSIEFPDLWHLFQPGQEICSSEGQSQVYRILTVTGGRPYLCSREQAGMPSADSEETTGQTAVASASAYSTAKIGSPFTIHCFYYQFDGKAFCAIEEFFRIQRYDGEKLLTSFPCLPVHYLKPAGGTSRRDEYILRGKRFVELACSSDVIHKRYHGLTLDEFREEIDSEIIIDPNMAWLKKPEWQPKFGVLSQPQLDRRETLEFLDSNCTREGCCYNSVIYNDHEIDRQRSTSFIGTKDPFRDSLTADSNWQPDDFLVCTSKAFGFVLRSRKWAILDISLIKDIEPQQGGFDSLVLPPGHRETLLALVKTHSKGKGIKRTLNSDQQSDLVRGKGKGLIILLHGEPGVGKTSTAECVAEYTQRPLFQVTCGDIGQTAEDVEARLENHFQLAHKWGCVLLLDEADVFLMARNRQDLTRNAIVSVFLRVLEYYSGILFLTTNRIGSFDAAFRSRIHMSLYYPKLDLEATKEIWKMNLERTIEIWKENITVSEKDRKDILTFAESHFAESAKTRTTWNGRQIRNAFQTAIALSEYEAHLVHLKWNLDKPPTPLLQKAQFEKVAKASKHFDQYVRETVGGSAEDIARERQERRDDLGVDDIDQEVADTVRPRGTRGSRRGIIN